MPDQASTFIIIVSGQPILAADPSVFNSGRVEREYNRTV